MFTIGRYFIQYRRLLTESKYLPVRHLQLLRRIRVVGDLLVPQTSLATVTSVVIQVTDAEQSCLSLAAFHYVHLDFVEILLLDVDGVWRVQQIEFVLVDEGCVGVKI